MLAGKMSSVAYSPKVSNATSSPRSFCARGCLFVVEGKAVVMIS